MFSAEKLPPPYKDYQVERSSRVVYLRNLARSRVLIYVRGPHDSLSFKFGEMMALGRPIVGQKLRHNRDTLYRHPYFDEQFAYEDPQEIVDKVVELLANPAKMEAIARSNEEVFESTLTPAAGIANILNALLAEGSL